MNRQSDKERERGLERTGSQTKRERELERIRQTERERVRENQADRQREG